jgi:hypothetical protein
MNDEAQAGDERAEENPMVRGVVLTGLLVAGSLYYLNRRRQRRDGSGVVEEVQPAMSQGGELVHRGQQFLENTLDRLSEQAMAEVKVILKNGLHRLEEMVDDL